MMRPDSANRRKKDFKKGIDADEARRKREDNIIELRKNKRDENLQKKRQVYTPQAFGALEDSNRMNAQFAPQKVDDLPLMVKGVYSEDPQEQFQATQRFRKLLSIERNPPIQQVIDQNVIPKFVEFLQRGDYPLLQFEAAWALTNVASGTSEHTKRVIDAGAVPIFVQLLSTPYDDVREQAVWALGNIAGDSHQTRDMVLQCNALPPLLEQLKMDNQKISMLRNATWTLSNFCRGKPPPSFHITKAALPVLRRLLESTDDEVLTDACWALSYLSDGENERIQKVIDAGVCRRLVELLMHQQTAVLVPALRTVGNIVTGTDQQTQTIINCGALQCLYQLLQNRTHKKAIKKEACWTISNITAGTKEQIQQVMEAGLVPILINLLEAAEYDIKKEAAWAISNATSGGTATQIMYVVERGCIKPLCDLIDSDAKEPRITVVALEGLENILRVGLEQAHQPGFGGENPYLLLVQDAGGIEKLEALVHHPNREVYNKAMQILNTYFEVESEENLENMAPGIDASQQHYQFGMQMPQQTFFPIDPMAHMGQSSSASVPGAPPGGYTFQ